MIRLDDLDRCLHGIIPNVIATADGDNVPNVSYVSQLHVVDEAHVAVSCQFFNKTRQNLDVNPRATIELYDPISFEAFRMRVRFLRSETSGELFGDCRAAGAVLSLNCYDPDHGDSFSLINGPSPARSLLLA